MSVHFPEEPPEGAPERALRQEMQTWQADRGPAWAELLSRAAEVRQRRRVWSASAGGAAALALVVALAVAGLVTHGLPPGLETLRERLLP